MKAVATSSISPGAMLVAASSKATSEFCTDRRTPASRTSLGTATGDQSPPTGAPLTVVTCGGAVATSRRFPSKYR